MRPRLGDHARQEGDPDSGGHQFKDKINLTAASRNLWRESRVAAGVEYLFIEREAFLEHDEGERGESCKFDRLLTGERMVRGQQRDQRLSAHVLPIEILWYRVQQCRQVEAAGAQEFFQTSAVMHRELYVDTRIAAPERREHRSEQGAAAEPRNAQAQRSTLQSTQFVQFGDQALALGEQAERTAVDDPARGGELAAMADAIEQRHAEFVLQLLDCLAD